MGYAHLTDLATHAEKDSFVSRTESVEYWEADAPQGKIKAIAEYLEDVRKPSVKDHWPSSPSQAPLASTSDREQFRVIPQEELPRGVEYGISCTTITINAPKHLVYLHNLLKDQYGVHFVRRQIPSIHAARLSSQTKIVFNCTGNAARTLAGVEDGKCYPTRGQVVLARAPEVTRNVMRHGRDEETYVIPRPQSNGNVILGGYMQKGNR